MSNTALTKFRRKNTCFIDDLHNVMSNKATQHLIELYGKTSADMNVLILYFKLYQNIWNTYKDKFNENPKREQMTKLISIIMKNSLFRREVMKEFEKFQKYENIQFDFVSRLFPENILLDKTNPQIQNIHLNDRIVLIHVDFNVPMKNTKIINNRRLITALPTIKYALIHGAKNVVLMSHVVSPKEKNNKHRSLKPLIAELERLLGENVGFELPISEPRYTQRVVLLENLSFYTGNNKHDNIFQKQLSKWGDVYIFDAFRIAHRKYSVIRMNNLEKAIGLLVDKELMYFNKILKMPSKPFVCIMGRTKISNNIKLIKNLLPKINHLIIGSEPIIKFNNYSLNIRTSMFDSGVLIQLQKILKLAKKHKVQVHFPIDYIVASSYNNDAKTQVVTNEEGIPEGTIVVDIGPKSIEKFSNIIYLAETVIMNGPLGEFKMSSFSTGSFAIMKALAETKATTIIVGDNTASCAEKSTYAGRINHISTGDGACLALLKGCVLPAIQNIN